ncbi:MAG: PAS domain S-box protein [Desulfovibrio sp.]
MSEISRLKAEIKQLKSQLKHSESKFRMLFDGIEDAVFVFPILPDGSRGPILEVNEASCERLGYSREEFSQMTVEQLDAPDTSSARPTLSKRFGQRSTSIFEVNHATKSGEIIPTEVSARKFTYNEQPMVLSIARDIRNRQEAELFRANYTKKLEAEVISRTRKLSQMNDLLTQEISERQHAEDNYQRTENSIRAILDASHQCILLLGLNGTILHCNDAVGQLYGHSPNQLVGENVYDHIPQDLISSRRKHLDNVIATKQPVTFQDVRNGDSYFNSLYPVIEDGSVARVAVFAENISSTLQKEKELAESRHLQSILYQIMNHASNTPNLYDFLRSTHDVIRTELRADNFYVALINENKNTLDFHYCSDETIKQYPPVTNFNSPDSKRISVLPIRERRIVQLSKKEILELNEQGVLEAYGTIPEVWLGIPLLFQGKYIGILAIQHYNEPNFYNGHELQFISACATQIASAIQRKNYEEFAATSSDIFLNIPSGLFIFQYSAPDTLTLVAANPTAEKITGVHTHQRRGQDIRDIWPDYERYKVFTDFINPIINGEEYVTKEVEYRDNITSGIFRVHAFYLPDDKVGIAFEDISKEKKAEQAIRESEEQYRVFFENNHSAMLIVDPSNGDILDTNAAAESFYKYSKEIFRTKTVFDLNKMTRSDIQERMENAATQKVTHFTSKHALSTGEMRDVEIFSGPFELHGKTHLISIIHDITERLKNEAELAQAKNAAEQASKAKDEFLANISHEVRTPISGVMGMLQLMLDTRLNTEQFTYIETALQSSRGLLRVINDVLDFSKVEAGKLEIFDDPFNVTDIIDQCRNLFKLQTLQKSIELDFSIDKSVEGYFRGDAGRIRQILFNILGNSIKFTEAGYIFCEVYAFPHPATGKDRLFFSVTDCGVGIPDPKIDYIFESFTQVDGSLTRKYQGTGLGLPIVKRLVELMGGTISVISELGVGTTVTFCVQVEKLVDHPDEMNRSHLDTTKLRTLHILLVEDEAVNRLAGQRLLEKIGHKVTCAENGRVCLDKLQENNIDLIFMDIQMPEMDGLQATEAIRTDNAYSKHALVPIIALTAHAAKEDKDIAMAKGMTEYLSKPFDLEQLQKLLLFYSLKGNA